jgi:hypothetical protein
VDLYAQSFEDSRSGNQLVAVRVEPGENPPYFAKGRGVKVRVGDTDIDADPRALEFLFARREQFSTRREQHHTAFRARIGSLKTKMGKPVILRIFLAPLIAIPAFRFSERTTRELRDMAQEYLIGSDLANSAGKTASISAWPNSLLMSSPVAC